MTRTYARLLHLCQRADRAALSPEHRVRLDRLRAAAEHHVTRPAAP